MPEGLAAHAWYAANARGQCQPIGGRAASPLGLHDIYGNAAEWVLGSTDPFAVVVGGHADSPETELGSEWRRALPPFAADPGARTGLRLLAGVAIFTTDEKVREAERRRSVPVAEVQPLPPIIEPKTALLAQAAPPTSAALTGAWSFRIGAFTRVLMIALAVVLGVAAFIVIRAAVTKRHSRLKMIALPGGMFWMGSPEDEPERSMDEGPRHQVRIAPFAIGKAAVTFAQYDAFCDATGRAKPADQGWGRDQHPVINVTWDDATAYAVWLSKKTGVPYRLPSEAEWEYAARAGTQTPFWTGPCINTDQANYDGNYDYNGCGAKTGVNRQQTVPVGSLPANPWGLHEVHGNVWEWVEDHSHYTYGGAPTDGSAWEAGGRRVVRGGSWHYSPRNLRSANRNLLDSGYRNNDLGFRVARTLSP